NNGDLPKSPFLQSPLLPIGGTVPIGRRDFEHRLGLLPRAQPYPTSATRIMLNPCASGPSALAIGLINRSTEEERRVQVLVRDNNVDQALRVLKKKMQREGVFREMKLRGHYEKPSEKRVREKAEAIRRYRKLLRKKLQREALLPMKPKPTGPGGPAGPGGPGAGRSGPPRAPRFG